eukprot:IDg17754t1
MRTYELGSSSNPESGSFRGNDLWLTARG